MGLEGGGGEEERWAERGGGEEGTVLVMDRSRWCGDLVGFGEDGVAVREGEINWDREWLQVRTWYSAGRMIVYR